MPDIGHCKDCLWWNSPTEETRGIELDFLSDTDKQSPRARGFGRCLIVDEAEAKILARYDAGYEAELLTAPDFGCVQWEAVPNAA